MFEGQPKARLMSQYVIIQQNVASTIAATIRVKGGGGRSDQVCSNQFAHDCFLSCCAQGFPFGDFDINDVMLPEDDDMGIHSDEESNGLQNEDVPQESGFANVVGACQHRCMFVWGRVGLGWSWQSSASRSYAPLVYMIWSRRQHP
jgi:hypothetical protein